MANSTSRLKANVDTFITCFAVVCLGFSGCTSDNSSSNFSGNPPPMPPHSDAASGSEDHAPFDTSGTLEDPGVSDVDNLIEGLDEGSKEQDEALLPESLNALYLNSPVVFRVSNLWISAPPLCVSLNEDDDCVNMEAMANAALTASLIDQENPLDLLGILTASGDEEEASHLQFGEAECLRSDGAILSCEINDSTTDFGPVLHSEENNCWPSKEDYKSDSAWMAAAPCFFTQEKVASLNILDTKVTVQEMQVLGHLKEEDGEHTVPAGQIIAFLPEDVANLVVMDLETQSIVDQISLADLLHSKAMVMHSSGQMGWNVVLSFDAEKVPLSTP
jgi:hypothetical protein